MNSNNPYIVLSVVNTYLRDKYKDLDELCDKEDYNKQELIELLKSINYEYDANINQFKEC